MTPFTPPSSPMERCPEITDKPLFIKNKYTEKIIQISWNK